MLANHEFRTEEPQPVLHHGQQIPDLAIRAPFQTLSQQCPDPQRLKSLMQIVRSRQPPLELEQFR